MRTTPRDPRNKRNGRAVALLLAASVLSACGAPAGPVINVNEALAIEYGREALEHARQHAGTEDVSPEEVVAGFQTVIEENPLKEWWIAEAVGAEMTQISFLVISEEYKLSNPTVTYPEIGKSGEKETSKGGDTKEEAPEGETQKDETSKDGTSKEETKNSAPEETAPDSTQKITPPAGEGGAEGMSAGEEVVLAESPVTTIAADESSAYASETADDHSDGAAGGHGAETSSETSSETSLPGEEHSLTNAPTDAHHSDEKSSSGAHGAAEEQKLAGGLPREAFSIAVAACVRELHGELRVRGGPCPGNEESHGAGESHSAGHGAHWGYGESDGPEAWGSLSEEYEKCRAGMEQSPIDLSKGVATPLAEIELRYRATAGKASDTGHTLNMEFELGSSAVVQETSYRLVGVHYHAGSEHTLGGEKLPMELHFVHKSADEKIAVLGVLVEQGSENLAWEPLIKALANAPKSGAGAESEMNLQQLLPEAPEVFRYQGSLTTPPCTEGVVWSVVAEPVQFSAAQISKLTARYSQNARGVQPLHERQLLVGAEVG
jgi:carbonic anhydrase